MFLKLNRDQVQTLRKVFFPYIEAVCWSPDKQLNVALPSSYSDLCTAFTPFYMYCQYRDLDMIFEHAVFEKNMTAIKLSNPQAIALYIFLQCCPISKGKEYFLNLKQFILVELDNNLQLLHQLIKSY